jgi:hypothetical protein
MTTNLVDLQDKIQKMLNGEKKRREIAGEFLNEFKNILQEEVAETIWGSEDSDVGCVVWVRNKVQGAYQKTDYYYRYDTWEGVNSNECSGFYKEDNTGSPVWGTEIIDLKGADFWAAMRCIIGWVEVLVEIIDGRNESRDKLIGLVNKTEQ